MLSYFTGSQMQASQDHAICWVSEEILLIFTTENTRLDNVRLAFGCPILVASRKLVKVPEPSRFDGQRHYPASNLTQEDVLTVE